MLLEALAQTSMFEREWHVHVSHRQFASQQLLLVWPLALDFIFAQCVPLAPEF